MADELNH